MTRIGLLGRDGRIPAVIPVEPATGKDLKEVLKFHIKRVMPEESSFDLDNYDFSRIMKKLNISDDKGCYSNDNIRAAADEIRKIYDKKKKENPALNFKDCVEYMILKDKCLKFKTRDIDPDTYGKYYEDLDIVGGDISFDDDFDIKPVEVNSDDTDLDSEYGDENYDD